MAGLLEKARFIKVPLSKGGFLIGCKFKSPQSPLFQRGVQVMTLFIGGAPFAKGGQVVTLFKEGMGGHLLQRRD